MSEFEDLKREILNNLSNKPISEKVLAKRIGVTDGTIRRAVVSLIQDKHLLLSNSHGLWIENDPYIILDHCDKIYTTGMAYLTRQSNLKKAVAEKFGQLTMKELGN